ncbi:MAG TPA: LLM class flavin-dependent oxidoreductase [Acidimicrobiia bacterium]|nr:LLM class flavin-dependent oxidoreductase [Acidimicrobiia bacterium]
MTEGSKAMLGLGVTAGISETLARDLASRCQELGYQSLWSNDGERAPGLETLAHFAVGAPNLELGVGVLPLDRNPPAKIKADIDRLGLDPSRLWVGVGSGQLRPPVEAVRRGVEELRELLPEGTRIAVAAMRPRLCRLGGEIADAVLLNWMLPAQAARARIWMDAEDRTGDEKPVLATYVRVAVGPQAQERLTLEESRYRVINEGHRRHFAAMDVAVGSVGIAASRRAEVVDGLEPYRSAVDLTIVRALVTGEEDSLIAVAEAAAPT